MGFNGILKAFKQFRRIPQNLKIFPGILEDFSYLKGYVKKFERFQWFLWDLKKFHQRKIYMNLKSSIIEFQNLIIHFLKFR